MSYGGTANPYALTGSEPRTRGGVPLVEMPQAGDEAALVGVLASIIADLCGVAGTAQPKVMHRVEAA